LTGAGVWQAPRFPVDEREETCRGLQGAEASEAEAVTDGKYASVGFLTKRGASNRKPVLRDSDGKVGGVQTEHWDGRVDAKVVPASVELRVIQGGDR